MFRLGLLLLLPVLIRAHQATIVRDDWGIAHIHGHTDADAVFGALYAQAEDDFHRIEVNYLTNLGRLAEAEGEGALMQDLRQRLFVDDGMLQRQYAASPVWLRALMDAFAAGLNQYLADHPETHPMVIRHFEPWMALCFTEGSIGGDVERIDLKALQAFYQKDERKLPISARLSRDKGEPSGSNGIAISAKHAMNGHALLLINPHTSFFFRSELQMTSDEGLNAYGAVTWGQFFVYQGFNHRVGWMHTSSGVDAVDEWAETVVQEDGHLSYRYGPGARPLLSSTIVLHYKQGAALAEKRFTVYRTHHGPVVRSAGGKWISFRMMQEPVKALEQSFLRTKAHDYKSYLEVMQLQANSSNNTVFADADGDIAYFHGNYLPRRDPRFNWTKPVDGSNPATEWQGLHSVDELPHLLNPPSGWLFNVNNWPWFAAGSGSLQPTAYPAYVESGGETARGRHALRLLENSKPFTLESLVAAAYDSYLPWFAPLIPKLPEQPDLTNQVNALKNWDLRWSTDSTATTLAVFWGTELLKSYRATDDIAGKASAAQLGEALRAASRRLEREFGRWDVPWGEVNRYQRLTADIKQPFNDSKPSMPVPFTSSTWGSLASFGAHAYPGTKKWYGTSGNSFVAAVEFGDEVRARAVTAGGESGHPDSKHFNDEAERYATGNLRAVYFYPKDLEGHVEQQHSVSDVAR